MYCNFKNFKQLKTFNGPHFEIRIIMKVTETLIMTLSSCPPYSTTVLVVAFFYVLQQTQECALFVRSEFGFFLQMVI
jgi:hypothetical protein